MDQIVIGKFIAKCRKEQKLTQAQLAEKLNITDRAVSKWETGKSMPDSSIMLELCAILGITVNELLTGERLDGAHYEQKADENLITLKKKDENNLAKNKIFAILFSVTLFIGMLVCIICDIATAGKLTWSLIPISSIIFTWVISFPIIMLGKNGVVRSLAACSAFILPYLYILRVLTGVSAVFTVGAVMAVISVIYLWLVFVIFTRLQGRKILAWGITFLLAIPVMLVINVVLSNMLSIPAIDMWDILAAFVLLIAAFGCFVWEYARKKR